MKNIWMPLIIKNNSKIPIIILGNKSDLQVKIFIQ